MGEGWVYIVLTLGQEARSEGELWEIYRRLYERWDKLRKRITRSFGEFEYIALVEKHGDGMPHINILVWSRKLWEVCAGESYLKFWQGQTWETGEEYKELRLRWWNSQEAESIRNFRRNWLESNAVDCGFGFRTWIEPVRSDEAIAGYFLKLCSEIAKVNQIPVCAPKNFRRLRASRGLLPKTKAQESREKGEFSGGLLGESIEKVSEMVVNDYEGKVVAEFDKRGDFVEAIVNFLNGEIQDYGRFEV